MSTVADELLNDFGSSGDEAEDGDTNGLVKGDDAAERENDNDNDAMDVDNRDIQNGTSPSDDQDIEGLDDAEATKIKVEKLELGGVKDVRSVASLMQALQPVLEVSPRPYPRDTGVYIISRTSPDAQR